MSNNTYVELLHMKENELIAIIKYHNIFDIEIIKDLLQDLYVRILITRNIDRFVINNGPNMYIIFEILRNIIYNYSPYSYSVYYSKKNNYTTGPFTDNDIIYEDPQDIEERLEQEIEDDNKYKYIFKQAEEIEYWFDRNVVQLYLTENNSIRSLSRDTKICNSTLQKIIYKFKEDCRDKYKNQNE